MSTHIIDEIQAIRIPKEKTGSQWSRDIYILCELGGDNNCFNSRTNRRARDWSAITIGEEWDVIKNICEHAGYFSGGMTRFARGRGTPEAYIRRCRKAIKEAHELGNGGELRPTFEIRFTAEEKTKYSYQHRELIEAGAVPEKIMQYGEEIELFRFNPDHLEVWFKGIHGRGWRNVEIDGPRTE